MKPWFAKKRIWLASIAVAFAACLAGCASLGEGIGYYWQSVTGHFAMLQAAKPIDDWLAQPALEEPLRAKLRTVQEIRQFASKELGLPDNASYTKYADLKRQAVVWNVVATPKLSLKLKTWCFPVAGCVSYKGYYAKADADAYAAALKAEGFDVQVGPVPAYSTLGWFDDPVLNTFIHYPEAELARLIFHELGHQVLYVKNDSTFNESFATAMEEIAVERWLTGKPEKMRKDYIEFQARRQQFLVLLKGARSELETAFGEVKESPAEVAPNNISDAYKARAKSAIFAKLQADYQALKQSWGVFTGYDRFFAQELGNAHLASVGTYTDMVPGFRRELNAVGNDLPKYFERTKALAKLEKSERDKRLASESLTKN